MKPLTDAQVAKALGWKYKGSNPYGIDRWQMPGAKLVITRTAPRFTTSLDAIAAEVDARGLFWEAGRGTQARIFEKPDAFGLLATGKGPTAPLALCRALLAYLKERP